MSDTDPDVDPANPGRQPIDSTDAQHHHVGDSTSNRDDQLQNRYSQVPPNPAPNRQRSSRTRWEGLPAIGGGPRFASTQLARVKSASGRTEYGLSLWAKLDKGFHYSVVDGFPCAFKRNYSEIAASCSATTLAPLAPPGGSSNHHHHHHLHQHVPPPRELAPVPTRPLPPPPVPANDAQVPADPTSTASSSNPWTILVQPPGSASWIQCTNLRLAPRVIGTKGEPIVLVQRTCKRDRGPTLAVVPQPCWPTSTAPAAAFPLRAGADSTAMVNPGASVVWERVQFSKATPAAVLSGKSASAGGEHDGESSVASFCMYIELLAAPVGGGADLVIAHAMSDPFVVRSRSPGQYAMANAIAAGGLVPPVAAVAAVAAAAARRGVRDRTDSGTFAPAAGEARSASVAVDYYCEDSRLGPGVDPILAQAHPTSSGKGPDLPPSADSDRVPGFGGSQEYEYQPQYPDLYGGGYHYPSYQQPTPQPHDYRSGGYYHQSDRPRCQVLAFPYRHPPASPPNRHVPAAAANPAYYGGYFPPTPLSGSFAATSPRGFAATNGQPIPRGPPRPSALVHPIDLSRASSSHPYSAYPHHLPLPPPPRDLHPPAAGFPHAYHAPQAHMSPPRSYAHPTARFHASASAAASASASSASVSASVWMYSIYPPPPPPRPDVRSEMQEIGTVPSPGAIQRGREHGLYASGYPQQHYATAWDAYYERGWETRVEGAGYEYPGACRGSGQGGDRVSE